MLLTESKRPSDVLLFQDGYEYSFNIDQITLANGTAVVTGQVLGQSTLGTPTSAVKASGANTGTGTLVLDSTAPLQAKAKVGTYTVRVDAVGQFIVLDPNGVSVGVAEYASAGAVTFNDQVKFLFTDTSTHFVVGDGFDITVPAGSGTYVQVAPAAFDGSQNAAAIAMLPYNATAAAWNSGTAYVPGNQVVVSGVVYQAIANNTNQTPPNSTYWEVLFTGQIPAVTRGPAIVKSGGLTWTAAMSGGQITAGLAQLAALGITSRVDYGV